MKLGGGGRFQALKEKLAAKGGVSDPAAVAASIGRKKYGAKKMASMAAAGRTKKGAKATRGKKRGGKASGLPPWLVTPKGAGD